MNSEVLFANTVEHLRAFRHVIILIGAGIFTESGIATFRDHLTGLWSRYDQQQLATPAAFVRDPGWYGDGIPGVVWARLLGA